MNLSVSDINIEMTEQPHFSAPSRYRLALRDIKQGIQNWPIWILLGWQDIRLRYRRSSLGPFWITISMAITIYTMGFLYGHLFKVDLRNYYPFLAAGMLTWNLMNLLIIDGTNAFIDAENYLKQMKLPYIVFSLRVVWRSFIIFAHNIVVIIPIIILFHIHLDWSVFMLLPGLMIIALSGICYGFILAMIGARFRDVSQIITSLMQVAFFLTPIMWNPNALPPRYDWVVMFNPFAHFVDLVRAPLTGNFPSTSSLIFTLLTTAIGFIAAFWLFRRVRHRIIYWL